MNGYELADSWCKWSYSRRGVKPIHHAVIRHIFDLANESRWSEEFQIPTGESCIQLGISDSETFRKALKDLETWKVIRITQESRNQHEARWATLIDSEICLPKKPTSTTIGTPISTTVSTTIGSTIDTTSDTTPIYKTSKQVNNKQETIGVSTPQTQGEVNEIADSKPTRFTPPAIQEVSEYVQQKTECSSIEANRFAERFVNFYESKGWKVGKDRMKNWQAAVRTWLNKEPIQPSKPKEPERKILRIWDNAINDYIEIDTTPRKVHV